MKQRTVFPALLLSLALLLGCAGCGAPDPHEGMMQVADGMGGLMWAPRIDTLPENTLTPSDFERDEQGHVRGVGNAANALPGVDVSFYQGEIDWTAVAASGMRFAVIRAGYRGYTEGDLFADERFAENMEGAAAQGLLLGVYFFSQAVTPEEAEEEADFVLSLLSGRSLSLPVFFDWEPVDYADSPRTDGVDGRTVTACAGAFCRRVEAGGYGAGVYFNRHLGYFGYDLSQLGDFAFWFAGPGDYPDLRHAHRFWQYAMDGAVDGIQGQADLNLWFPDDAPA